ncbi:MAG: hypothetical protein RIT28_1312, partial [Pseudomonadota bacterium]
SPGVGIAQNRTTIPRTGASPVAAARRVSRDQPENAKTVSASKSVT